MALNAGGHELVVAGPPGDVRRVDLSIESWIDIASTVASRNLAAHEALKFLDGQDSRTSARWSIGRTDGPSIARPGRPGRPARRSSSSARRPRPSDEYCL